MLVKITAIKFETINGKKVGRAFDFKLDPKKMAVHKTEATVKKKVEEYVVKSGVFKKEELKSVQYDMKEFLETGKEVYPFSEALEDAYFRILMEEALAEPWEEIRAEKMPWME